MTKHVLTYFGLGGRAEPLRLAFVVGKTPFTNKAMTFSEFKEAKDTLPMGQLPVLDLEDNDGNKKTLAQSSAILRYIGKITGLYPSDPVDAMEVDMIIDAAEDVVSLIVMTLQNAPALGIQDEPWPKEQILEMRARLMNPVSGKIFSCLKVLEDALVANESGWFVGDKPTIADFKVHHLVGWLSSGVLDGIPASCLDAFPLLEALHANVENLPEVIAFRAKHGTKYDTFDFEPEN